MQLKLNVLLNNLFFQRNTVMILWLQSIANSWAVVVLDEVIVIETTASTTHSVRPEGRVES